MARTASLNFLPMFSCKTTSESHQRRARHICANSMRSNDTRLSTEVEELRVVIRGVRREDLRRDVQALALVRNTHVLAEHVVILHHVQLPDGRTRRRVRHPRAFPRPVLVDCLFHAARAWELHLPQKDLPQPSRLQPMSQDVVERGDLAPNECNILQPG